MMIQEKDSERVRQKFAFYEDFWKGDGAFPILFTKPHLAKDRNYISYDLVEQHQDVNKLVADALLAIAPHLDLIDDGIPTIRADLGTTLLPSGLGLEIAVQPNQHPWLKQHLTLEQFQRLPSPLTIEDIQQGEIPLARQFYQQVRRQQQQGRISADIFPYVPDTQGIFDLSHLLLGNDLFLLLQDDPEMVHRLQRTSLELFLAGTRMFKQLLGEASASMVHGHGMNAGVWFPHTGARISEDSCILISGRMIQKFCAPYIKQAITPFGRGFMHYCGKHEGFLKILCEMEEISTLNLGNPEMYDLEELFALLGKTGTVYFGHLDRQDGEAPQTYLERLAGLCGQSRTRLILVADYQPRDSDEKISLVNQWHRLTRNL